MNRLFIPAIAIATLFSTAAVAEDKTIDVDIDVVKKTDSPVTRVIIITADGKKREIKIGDGKFDGIKHLPKGIRVRVEKAVNETKKGGKDKPKVTRKVVGRAVIVGPDGKKREIKFGDGKFDKKALDGLPKDIRIRIERAVKGLPKGGAKAVTGRAVIIGPDGKKREINLKNFDGKDFRLDLPKDVQDKLNNLIKGKGKEGALKLHTIKKGIFIGPDGKKREFKIDGKDFDFEGSLKNLPPEVRAEVRKAMANRWWRSSTIRTRKGSSPDKLDLILKRLDQLQKQVDALRKKVEGK